MTARRSRGDGSVFYDDQRGVWTAVIELGRDPDTGRRTRRKASARTKTAALGLLDGMRADKRKAGTVGRRDLTVGQVIADYLAHPPADWRTGASTAQVARDHAARITKGLGRAKLATLTPSRVERFLAGMAADGYSTSSITQTRLILRAAIRRAERDGQVGRNVADLAEAPAGKRREPRSLTLAQVAALVDAAKDDPWWNAYVHAAIMLGLRPGELLGLRWADVDLDTGTVQVRHSLKEIPGPARHVERRLEELKTRQSRRTLAAPAAVTAALREHKRAQRAERLRLGAAWQDQDLVFPGADGAPCPRHRAAHGFTMLAERAGLGPGWTRYDARHTFASVLSHGGTDIEVIADAMGHANSRVTSTVYRHGLADRISAAASAFDKIITA